MNVPARVAVGPRTGSAEEWREIVEDFEREGTTATAYCEGRGLRPQTLLRWRRRLAREDEPAPAFATLGPAPAESPAWDADLGRQPGLRRLRGIPERRGHARILPGARQARIREGKGFRAAARRRGPGSCRSAVPVRKGDPDREAGGRREARIPANPLASGRERLPEVVRRPLR